jgi:hypothetical protein
MSSITIFRTQLVIGLLVWGIFVAVYWWPVLAVIGRRLALRQIAMLNAFRFEGLVFLMPAFVGQGLPSAFAAPAAYGDLATSVLAIMSIVAFRWERIALLFTVLYTAVGAADLINNVYRVITLGIGERPESLGVAYTILILYVPLLMITHGLTAWLLLKPGTLSIARRFTEGARSRRAPRSGAV